MTMRIAVAGFQHETNTFAPGNAGMAEFKMADSWPGLLLGTEVVSETRGMNLPIAGALKAARGVETIPILWCAAEPSGHVTNAAFDQIAAMILDGLLKAGPLDGIYLDLHGAMVTERHDDGEGALLETIRDRFGPTIPLAVSLDLHANISPKMVELADVVTIYRTYPHLDMAATGARCLRRLLQRIEGQRSFCAFRQVPFLVPLHAQNTGASPCRELYQQLETLESETTHADIALGFTAADVPDCGPSVIAYAPTQTTADTMADTLWHAILASRDRFDTHLEDPETAVEAAMKGKGPVVLADVQDNPGAGGTSDTTGILLALIDQRATNAILGVICDPEIAAEAHKHGPGSVFSGALGGKAALAGQRPLRAEFRVDVVSGGEIRYSGDMYGGGYATLGPSCLLSISSNDADVRVVVSSNRIQCLDLALFEHFGLEPSNAQIICVKSTVHYRAAFEPIAQQIVNVDAAGAFPCRLSLSDYTNLRFEVTSVLR